MERTMDAVTSGTNHRLEKACAKELTDQELVQVHGGAQSKGEEMCEFTEECERSQSHTGA